MELILPRLCMTIYIAAFPPKLLILLPLPAGKSGKFAPNCARMTWRARHDQSDRRWEHFHQTSIHMICKYWTQAKFLRDAMLQKPINIHNDMMTFTPLMSRHSWTNNQPARYYLHDSQPKDSGFKSQQQHLAFLPSAELRIICLYLAYVTCFKSAFSTSLLPPISKPEPVYFKISCQVHRQIIWLV